MQKCRRGSTFRLPPPLRRQKWHCRSPPASNHGAWACQVTILQRINGTSLCKPTFILGIHGGRHQLCSDLHPTAFLTIMSFPLCIIIFFFTWCFWAVPCLDHPSLEQGDSFTAKQVRSCARKVEIPEIKELQISTATSSPLYITSCAVPATNGLTPFKYLTVLNSFKIIWD